MSCPCLLAPASASAHLLIASASDSKWQTHFWLPFTHRAQDQATKFEADIGMPAAVLFFDCPEDEMEKRLLKRGETSGRSDDNTGVFS